MEGFTLSVGPDHEVNRHAQSSVKFDLSPRSLSYRIRHRRSFSHLRYHIYAPSVGVNADSDVRIPTVREQGSSPFGRTGRLVRY